ncbi:MAG: hypothetical protein ACK46O_03360 [Flavobacteriia bacterium]
MYKIILTFSMMLSSYGMQAYSQQQFDASIETTNIYDSSALGAAKITVKGGNAPYYILWSSGSTQQKVTGLKPGIYAVRVSDSKGRTIEKRITIEDRSSTTLSANP